jgi:hypothetical protein
MWDVFLSYSTTDRTAGDSIVADLRAAGLRVWYDKDYITAGDRIREKINEGIKKSTSFLLLASRRSLDSRWVLNELDAAMVREIKERRRVVIPILLGKITPSDLPVDLRGKNCLDLRGGFAKSYRRCRPSLLRSLVVITKGPHKYRTVIPIGEESTRYILSYRYLGVDEAGLLMDKAFDWLVKLFLKSPSGFVESRRRKRDFIRNYGHWGVRQLLKFFLDHSEVKLTKWFTEKDISTLFESINIFLMMYEIQESARRAGKTILMGVDPRRSVAFKTSPPGAIRMKRDYGRVTQPSARCD